MNFNDNQIKNYLINIKNRPRGFNIKIGEKIFSDKDFFVIAGPCAVESKK